MSLTIYHSLNDRIKINGKAVTLNQRCRQGCPLSPALFALFIEPLAQLIREDVEITGILFKETEHEICLYVGSSLNTLMSLLEQFGSYSGHKLNIQKTQILAYLPHMNIHEKYNLNWKTTDIKYLFVIIPKDLTNIYNVNYCDITTEIKQIWKDVTFNT